MSDDRTEAWGPGLPNGPSYQTNDPGHTAFLAQFGVEIPSTTAPGGKEFLIRDGHGNPGLCLHLEGFNVHGQFADWRVIANASQLGQLIGLAHKFCELIGESDEMHKGIADAYEKAAKHMGNIRMESYI